MTPFKGCFFLERSRSAPSLGGESNIDRNAPPSDAVHALFGNDDAYAWYAWLR